MVSVMVPMVPMVSDGVCWFYGVCGAYRVYGVHYSVCGAWCLRCLCLAYGVCGICNGAYGVSGVYGVCGYNGVCGAYSLYGVHYSVCGV